MHEATDLRASADRRRARSGGGGPALFGCLYPPPQSDAQCTYAWRTGTADRPQPLLQRAARGDATTRRRYPIADSSPRICSPRSYTSGWPPSPRPAIRSGCYRRSKRSSMRSGGMRSSACPVARSTRCQRRRRHGSRSRSAAANRWLAMRHPPGRRPAAPQTRPGAIGARSDNRAHARGGHAGRRRIPPRRRWRAEWRTFPSPRHRLVVHLQIAAYTPCSDGRFSTVIVARNALLMPLRENA